jgi:hypothetical protein
MIIRAFSISNKSSFFIMLIGGIDCEPLSDEVCVKYDDGYSERFPHPC